MHKLFISIFLLLLPINIISSQEYKHQIAICAIFQDESRFMKEWIDYHLSKGVEHFYLYNNNSTDDFQSEIAPYEELGLITLIDWPSTQKDWDSYVSGTQIHAYNNAINRCRGNTKWLALIDLDEFIIPISEKTILEVIENNFSECSGLCVNWQYYGTSNIPFVKKGEMLQKLVMKAPWDYHMNRFVKSIVRPDQVAWCPHPHYCYYLTAYHGMDTLHRPCEYYSESVSIEKIRINHYWTRDEFNLYNLKLPRYKTWGYSNTEELMERARIMNQVFDDSINNL